METAKISFVAGAYIIKDLVESKELQERNVHKIHKSKHPYPNFDMLIIEFEEPFVLIPGLIEPACLPTKEVKIGTKCYASGWVTANNKLHAVGLNVVDHQVCYERYAKI